MRPESVRRAGDRSGLTHGASLSASQNAAIGRREEDPESIDSHAYLGARSFLNVEVGNDSEAGDICQCACGTLPHYAALPIREIRLLQHPLKVK